MGSAIAERIKRDYPVIVFDKDKSKTAKIPGIKLAQNNIDTVKTADVIILAIKPQDFDVVLNEIKSIIKDKLVISIAAGKKTTHIEKIIGGIRVIRVMPNIGAKIGESETTLCKGKYAKDQDLSFAKELFNMLGKTWIIKEEMMDAATAISGSGPACIYYDMEINRIDPLNVPEEIKQGYIQRLTKAAEKIGFDSEMAEVLAVTTSNSSLLLTIVTGIPPAELRRQVTSEGGTTEAALKILAEGGSWEQAAEAAVKRAKELSES